jgi:hypothetical protein
MPSYFSAGEVEQLGGPPQKTLYAIVRNGGITPAIPSRGIGKPAQYSKAQAFAFRLSRWLRHNKGWQLQPAASVMQALLAMSEQRLLADFDAGKTHLLLVNGNAMPWLCCKATIHQNPEIDKLLIEATAAGITVNLQTVDVATAWADFCSKLNRKSRAVAKR